MLHDENRNDEASTATQGTKSTTAGQPHAGHLGDSLVDLERIGRLWATHGIRMGVTALQTSAVTLSQLASTLASLADGFKPEQPPVKDAEKQ